MTDTERTAAVAGACGGAGATRLAVEAGAALARDGRSVALLDAALATQGLADHVAGDLDPDLTRVLAGDADLEAALVELPVDGPGHLRVAPARAPFERLAHAETAAAARALEEALAAADDDHDHVLVDVPPVASNLAVAAVTAADAVGVVAPATPRGATAVARVRGRLADVGSGADAVVANRADDPGPLERADVAVPEHGVTDPGAVPAGGDDDAFDAAVAGLCSVLLGAGVDAPETGRGLLGGLR
jgi:septum site-determining protein MinD